MRVGGNGFNRRYNTQDSGGVAVDSFFSWAPNAPGLSAQCRKPDSSDEKPYPPAARVGSADTPLGGATDWHILVKPLVVPPDADFSGIPSRDDDEIRGG